MKNHKILVTNIPKLVTAQFDFIDQRVRNIADIDLAFNYDGHFDVEVLRRLTAYGVVIIGGPRLHKQEQAVVLERLEINHPRSYFNRYTLEAFNCIEEFDSYVDMDEFVVKPVLGARGIGVKKITRAEYKKCIENADEVNKIFKEEKEFLHKNGDICSSYIDDSFRGSMLIQEYICVKREFRVLYFKHGKCMVYERIKKQGQFCGNLTHGTVPAEVNSETYERYITPMICEFENLLNDLNYPWLSIDLYVDDNDRVGIFEFQMEFAYAGFAHKLVRNAMEMSLKHFIK